MFNRLLDLAVGLFVVAVLVTVAVHLLRPLLPALVVIALVAAIGYRLLSRRRYW